MGRRKAELPRPVEPDEKRAVKETGHSWFSRLSGAQAAGVGAAAMAILMLIGVGVHGGSRASSSGATIVANERAEQPTISAATVAEPSAIPATRSTIQPRRKPSAIASAKSKPAPAHRARRP